jgi:hypothetical protein
VRRNGRQRLEEALAMLVQNEAEFVARLSDSDRRQAESDKRHAENERLRLQYEREAAERFARIEAQMAEIKSACLPSMAGCCNACPRRSASRDKNDGCLPHQEPLNGNGRVGQAPRCHVARPVQFGRNGFQRGPRFPPFPNDRQHVGIVKSTPRALTGLFSAPA